MTANASYRQRGITDWTVLVGSRALRWSFIVLITWMLALAGCSGDDDDANPIEPGDAALDVRRDVVVSGDARGDAATSDTGPVGADVTADRQPDAPVAVVDGSDGGPLGSDASDAGVVPDVRVDVVVPPTDAADARGPDAVADVRVDVIDARAADVTVDVPIDIPVVVIPPETGAGEAEAGPVVLTSIAVTPTNASIANGTDQQFTAMGTYSDLSTREITTTVTWLSSNTGAATITAGGSAHGVGVAQTTISAAQDGITGQTNLTVRPAVLVSVAVTPTNPEIADGTTVQMTAMGTFSDGSTQNLTATAVWTSSDTGIATVTAQGGLVSSQSPGAATITATSNGVPGSTTLTVTNANLVSISIVPFSQRIANNTSLPYAATGIYSNGSRQDLTTQVTWASSADAIATISNDPGTRGVAFGITAGQTTISATLDTVTGTATLTVTNETLVSIAVTPVTRSLPLGFTAPFTAVGTFTDSSTQDITGTVLWESSNIAVATISNAPGTRGVATSVAEGTVNISATQAGIVGNASLTVSPALLSSITISPVAAQLARGTTLQYLATGVYSDSSTADLTTTVTWGSSNGAVAIISNSPLSNGLASGVTPGTTSISATFGGVASSTSLTVTPAVLVSINVTPTNPTNPVGTTRQFVAIGTYTDGSTQDVSNTATWTSSDTTFATISNAPGSQGVATAVATGTPSITATVTSTNGPVQGSSTFHVTPATLESIAVTPTNPSVAKGTNVDFTATGTYSDGSTLDLTTQATWGSSATAVASISNTVGTQGRAATIGEGTSSITATVGVLSGSTLLAVTPAVLRSIAVTPTNPSIAKGTTIQFTAVGTYSDLSTQNITSQVAWSSSDGTRASVGNGANTHGFATGLLAGATEIAATVGAVSGSSTLTITDAVLISVAVTPVNPSIANGTTRQFVATGTYTDGSTQNLTTSATWQSNNAAVATVDNSDGNEGLATGVSVGQATISAISGVVTGSTLLTVTAATIVSIEVTPVTPSIANGTTAQFVATGTYTDGTHQVLAQATWTSSVTSVAAISNAPASRGFVTSISPGTTTIRAAFAGQSGTTVLTVTAATLDSIDITPEDSTIANGTTRSFHAMGHYSDGSQQDLTTAVTWSSDNTAVAIISNTDGSRGLVTSVSPGGTLITATIGSGPSAVTQTTALQVSNATLQTITLLPLNRIASTGASVQYTAFGHYSDGTSQELTTQVIWSTEDEGVALISNASDSEGLATTVGTGTTNVVATLFGVAGSTALFVSAP